MCLSVVSIAYKKASRLALHLSSRFPVPGPARIRIGCEEWAPWSRPATHWCSHSYGPMVLILVLIRFNHIEATKIVGVLFLDRFDGFNGLYLNISIYFLYVHVHFKRIRIWLSLFVLSPPCKKREGCNSKGTTPAISRTSAKSRCCTWSKFCPVPKVFKMCENPYIWG